MVRALPVVLRKIRHHHADRILPVTDQILVEWGRIAAIRLPGDIDGLITTTAIVHDLIPVNPQRRGLRGHRRLSGQALGSDLRELQCGNAALPVSGACTMELSIKDPETERLARALSARTGETITVAIRRTIEERLKRTEAQARKAALIEDMEAMQQRLGALPVLDPRGPEEMIGYDENGVPN